MRFCSFFLDFSHTIEIIARNSIFTYTNINNTWEAVLKMLKKKLERPPK